MSESRPSSDARHRRPLLPSAASAAALLAATLAAGPAAAEDHPQLYIGASLGGHLVPTTLDLGELDIYSEPQSAESSLYGELRLGLDLSPAWAIEAAFGYLPFTSGDETNDGLDLAARVRWRFADVGVQPYLLVGGGAYLNWQPDPDGSATAVVPEAHYGIGLGPRVLDTLRLRFEVRHQLSAGIDDALGIALVGLAGIDVLPGAGEDAPPGDRDGDGVTDDRDRCPDEPEDKDGHDDADGCPEPDPPGDRDGDGITDDADRCPDEPEDKDGHDDADGCPEPDPPGDRDGDGVTDDRDACPDAPEDMDGADDADGCPDADPAPPKVAVTCERIEFDDLIFFETGEHRLRAEALPLVDEIARTLTTRPDVRRVRISGYADARGAEALNLRLSRQRAATVREALIARGVDKARLAVVARGESAPRASNETAEGQQQNRRVEFTITAADASASCPQKGK
ncbi:MAG: OmpA family protein [Myxococcales bacterium]|nr:OmpA family protein [Myxococcales bacterium]MCB9550928.1 OmpA family protein [Myxococcales bacterium]